MLYCLPSCVAFSRKSVVIFMSFYVMLCLPPHSHLAAFKTFSLPLGLSNFIRMYAIVFFYLSYAYISLDCLDGRFIVLVKFGNLWRLFLQIFYVSTLLSPLHGRCLSTHLGLHEVASQLTGTMFVFWRRVYFLDLSMFYFGWLLLLYL